MTNVEFSPSAAKVERYFSEGDIVSGRIALRQHLQHAMSLGTAQWALQFRSCIQNEFSLHPFRLHCLRSYTVEPLIPMLEAGALVYDIELTVSTGEFNTYAQEILDTDSGLYRESYDCVYLGILARDLCPGLWEGQYTLEETEGRTELDKAKALLTSLVQHFRQHSSSPLVIQGFESPPFSYLVNSLTDINSSAFEQLNTCIEKLAEDHPSVNVTNYASIVALYGHQSWFDPKKWRQARQPVSASHLSTFAESLMHYIVPLATPPAKVIVTDLDHTLWHGVIGEEGIHGIRITDKGKNGGHLQYQNLLKQLQKAGFLLTISSKNDYDYVVKVIDNIADMQLKLADFACIRANWAPKVTNIQAIATELNIGLDSIIFIDDNPVEREAVARQLPQVTVIELSESSQGYAASVGRCARLSRLRLSEEDRHKTQQYAVESKRRKVMEASADMTTFLNDLGMRVMVSPITQANLSRASQLTKKTNQFNVTTRRYEESDLQKIMDQPDRYRTYMACATDRFGDHGWISVGLIEVEGNEAWFDSLLMSCRVLGRGVESAFISYIAQDLKCQGIDHLYGIILQTDKNHPAQSVFMQHHFMQCDDLPTGCVNVFLTHQDASYWYLDLKNGQYPVVPSWIEVSP